MMVSSFSMIKIGFASSDLNVWYDSEGKLWVENSFYKIDLSTFTHVIVKTGTEPREWTIYNVGLAIYVGVGPGTGPGGYPYYAFRSWKTNWNDQRIIEETSDHVRIYLQGNLRITNTLGMSDSKEIGLYLTFYAGSGLIKIENIIKNNEVWIGSTSESWDASTGEQLFIYMRPGGDEANDYYFYSGANQESAYPEHGGFTKILKSEDLSPFLDNYVYTTVYDKNYRQGFAVISEKETLTDYITDINYGVAEISYSIYHPGSYLTFSQNAKLASRTLYFYFYETQTEKPYQPVEDIIRSIRYKQYEVWAVSDTDPSYPVVIYSSRKVLFGAPIFENLEHYYNVLEPNETRIQSLELFLLDIIHAISEAEKPSIAIFEPDMLDNYDDWLSASNDWTFLVYQLWTARIAISNWQENGYISHGELIDNLNKLFDTQGRRAYDVLVIDQCMQADTPVFTDEMIQLISDFHEAGGAIIISGTVFVDWASLVRLWRGEPDLPYWYQGPINDKLLSTLFPGLSLDRTEVIVRENEVEVHYLAENSPSAIPTDKAPTTVEKVDTLGVDVPYPYQSHGFMKIIMLRAEITSYSISTGEFKAGDRVSAQVIFKNTGQEAWTFYVGFSVQDPNGKWWDAPYETVTLNPNEERTVTLYWTVPSEAPAGSYNARVAVWGGKQDNKLVNLLDYKEQSEIFKVTKEYVIEVKPEKYCYIFDNTYIIRQYYVLYLVGKITDTYGNPVSDVLINVVDPLMGICTYVKSDSSGLFSYEVYANKIGLFKFSFSFEGTKAEVTLCVVKELKKAAYITVKYKGEQDPTYCNILITVDIIKERALQVTQYYYEQSYGSVFIVPYFITSRWMELKKSYADYGNPPSYWEDESDAALWQSVVDDAIALTGIDENCYDAILVIQTHYVRAFTFPDNFDAPTAPGKKVILDCLDGFRVMAHELGHAIFKFWDYYENELLYKLFAWTTGGWVGHWCLMGNGTELNPPSSIMSWNKIQAGWLTQKFVDCGTYEIKLQQDLKYEDDVLCYGNPSVAYYIFERREYPDGVDETDDPMTTSGVYRKLLSVDGIMMYRATPLGVTIWPPTLRTRIHAVPHQDNRYDIPTLLPVQEGYEPYWYYDDFIGARFSAIRKNDGSVYLSIEPIPLEERLGRVVVSIINVQYGLPLRIFGELPENLHRDIYFDIDLHAYSFDGRMVGMNYTSGEYEIQIEGARASGNLLSCGPEWISVPSDIHVYFTLDPTPAREFMESLNISLPSNVTVTWQIVYYDENGTKYTSQLLNTSISLYEETILGIPAQIDIDPDTLNLRSKGKYITTYIELPDGYNPTDIDVSSVMLNLSISAELEVTEVEDYDGDGVVELMVKFDRSLLIEYVISSGTTDTSITLIITGRLEDGTPFVGKGIVKIKHVKTETYLK